MVKVHRLCTLNSFRVPTVVKFSLFYSAKSVLLKVLWNASDWDCGNLTGSVKLVESCEEGS